MSLVSTSVLSTYTGSTDTTLLAQIADGFVAWLQQWIPRYLGTSTTLTEVLNGPGHARERITVAEAGERRHVIWLQEEIAAASLASVKYRTALSNTWTDLSVDSNGDADLTDYEIRPPVAHMTKGRKLVRLSEPFPAGVGNLQIKYAHGYAEDAGPADVTLCILQAVRGWLSAKSAGGKKSVRVEGVSWSFENVASLPGVDANLLMNLKAGRPM